MKFLANENFSIKSVLYLREKGFDVSAIGLDNPSTQDEAVMNLASLEDRTILTFDRDYGELIFKYNYRYFQIQLPSAKGSNLSQVKRI
ncbi:MAG: DUF5615 family PIN-like protein [Bacteroidota bacterium]